MSDVVLIALIGAVGGIVSGTLAIVLTRQAARRVAADAEAETAQAEVVSVRREQMDEWRLLVAARNVENDSLREDRDRERAARLRCEAEHGVPPARRRTTKEKSQ